jgi:uncharacterized glyoxalase superfamily protein PhnB
MTSANSMPDAFDALRADTSPIDPSATFARSLHRQLLTELERPMTTTDDDVIKDDIKGNTVTGNTVTPYLVVDGAAAAIDFYVAAFGAVEHHRLVGDDGRVGHAELILGNSRIMMADEYPEANAISPTTRGGTSTSFTVEVPDVDAVFARAVQLGATELRPVADQFYGHRQGTLRDPWGHQWSVSSPIVGFDDDQYAANSSEAGFERKPGAGASATGAERHDEQRHDHQLKRYAQGDLYYFALPVADLAKAQAFYGAVLGWRFDGADTGHVGNISAPPGGVHSGATDIDLWFVVDDIHAAVATVRAHGGTAEEPVLYDSGWGAACTDDQGTRFQLSVPVDEYRL